MVFTCIIYVSNLFLNEMHPLHVRQYIQIILRKNKDFKGVRFCDLRTFLDRSKILHHILFLVNLGFTMYSIKNCDEIQYNNIRWGLCFVVEGF